MCTEILHYTSNMNLELMPVDAVSDRQKEKCYVMSFSG